MAKHFIGVEDYQISPEWKVPQRKKTSLAMGLSALYLVRRYCSGKKKKGGSGGSGKQRASKYVKDTRQRCTVKMHYSRSMSAHKEQIGRYLVKEGKGKDGTSPTLYGTNENEYRKNMTDKNFRIFLSPASNKVPLEALTKSFIDNLEMQTGYKLYWVAAEHYDTAHHHVHVLINGKDKNGRDVFFPPDMVKTFMRENAQNICTSLVGSRTREDIQKEKEGQLTANRYTYLDERIKGRLINSKFTLHSWDKEIIRRRLDHLQKLGICTYKDDEYVFSTAWENTLKTNGRYNMFLSARKEMHYTNEMKLELYDGSQGSVTGVVTKIYKTDEVSDNHAILLESIDGKAYFIPLFRKPAVRYGEGIEIKPERNQRGRLDPKVYKKTSEELLAQCKQAGYEKGYAAYLQGMKNGTEKLNMSMDF